MTKNTRPMPKERHRGATATAARAREKATAYHEAGHAVACYCLGVKVKSATVVPDKDQGTHGHARHENMFRGLDPEIDLSGRVRLQMERKIIISLAGVAAQRRYSRQSWRSHHGRSDFRAAADLALRIGGDGDGANRFLRWLELQTDRLVENRWQDIERVARALLERRILTGSEIVEIIEGEEGAAFKKSMKEVKARMTQRQQRWTEVLTPILGPVLEEIEQSMGLRSPDQKLRSSIVSAVRRSCMNLQERRALQAVAAKHSDRG
jgi:hypothetical protein